MVDAVLDGEPITPAGRPGRGCPSNEEARARGDRASVERNGRLWTAAAAGRREFGCWRRRSAKAALDGCPSYSGGRLRGACGCAGKRSCVFDVRVERPKTRFSKRILSRAERELVLLHVSRLESLPWRHSCNPAAGVENQHACGCCRPKPNSTHLLPETKAPWPPQAQ